ncbi:dihydrofolate reductase family protein [Paraflavitalea speifideaquila]|uniref:dihydrofolate reductase family protein n=1 Tax=Paraflavitalea speifideaquila TaxID=3076558 RepID=UPI0028E76722|nr:dihydrofolate reductase family protein [Paraflavitalea speifideiaquila]
MKKLIVSEWISLDGVFNSATMDQWFNPYHSDSRAKYIQDIIADCDTMLYGRHTYEMLYGYWSPLKNNEMGVADKLNQVKKYVVSANLKKPHGKNPRSLRKT